MMQDAVLEIIAQGAWNGGRLVDNSIYENKGMVFKGGIPVTHQSIEERMGVRTRMVAPMDERIGVTAFRDLLETSGIDASRIRAIIGATNIGEDKEDPGPVSRFPYELVRKLCPQALVFDLYAGCPGFNVGVEALFMLSLAGALKPGDLSVIIGAENIHRAKAFKPLDTANIIFGDDALATALETGALAGGCQTGRIIDETIVDAGDNFIAAIADQLLPWARAGRLDGIIIDNQLGKIACRIPASAARVQHALMERLHPEAAAAGTFKNFRAALELYDAYGSWFAYDVMTMDGNPETVKRIASAYTTAGSYRRLAAVFLAPGKPVKLSLIEGVPGSMPAVTKGVVATRTCSHGCFAGFIEAQFDEHGLFGKMDGKGVFLYATRGAKAHLTSLLSKNRLTLMDIDLLIEHQANFAMIPLTLEQVLSDSGPAAPEEVARFLAEKMVTNIHERGNCSVVCMQRLPYDLARDALTPDTVQEFPVNRNLERLRQARTILYDSVGAGMTRSSFLRRT